MIPTVIVTGARKHPAPDYVRYVLSETLHLHGALRVVEGGNRDNPSSVDATAAVWAYSHPYAVRLITMEADWATFGKRAGPFRNRAMAETYPYAVVLAFPFGESRGTRGMMDIAKYHQMKLYTYEIGDIPQIGDF